MLTASSGNGIRADFKDRTWFNDVTALPVGPADASVVANKPFPKLRVTVADGRVALLNLQLLACM